MGGFNSHCILTTVERALMQELRKCIELSGIYHKYNASSLLNLTVLFPLPQVPTPTPPGVATPFKPQREDTSSSGLDSELYRSVPHSSTPQEGLGSAAQETGAS